MSYVEDLANDPTFRDAILGGTPAARVRVEQRLPQSEAVIRRAAARVRAISTAKPKPLPREALVSCDQQGDNQMTLATAKQSKIRSLDGLLDYMQTDRNVWFVKRHILNMWEVGAKNPDTGEILTEQLTQIKAWLERSAVADRLTDIHDTLVASMAKHAPPYRTPRRAAAATDRVMMEFSPFDLHLGKLAWHAETESESYDTGIAESILTAVADHAIEQARLYRPECILFPVGNDFFHTDSSANQTTSGTQMDADSRHARMFVHGCDLLVHVIDKLRLVAPVEVLTVPGNHDRDSVFKLGTVLNAWYRNDAEVTINNAPTRRKYKRYGRTLLGFTHGDSERHPDLPLILAQERPQDWADTQFREFHLGHFHKRKETRHTAGDTYGGVVVRVLPSLSATDAWHYAQGYVKSIREAHSHFYSYDAGPIATVISNINNAALAATIGRE